MFFASDNAGPAHPAVMQALVDANPGYAAPYGTDSLMDAVRVQLREIFEAPDAAIYLVATGTAANSLALATLAKPWQTIFCTPVAHIHQDECNAPEFYTGAKLTLVGDSHRMTPTALERAIAAEGIRGVHGPQRGPVALTQVTERGGVYALDDLHALCAVAKAHDLPVHLDGARFANALVALGCSASDMTWRAGIDAVSFGATKNGCPGVEAVIFFDPEKAWEFELRRKRGAHLFSKHRYLSAQMQAYLANDLWLTSARTANANAAHLASGLAAKGIKLAHRCEANMIFAHLPRPTHEYLQAQGAVYNAGDLPGAPDDQVIARFVCDWSIDRAEIDRFLALL